jgi:hypothetical protein
MEESWFLYIVMFWWGSSTEWRWPMADLSTCKAAAEVVRYQGSDGDENESGVAAWCANGNQSTYHNAKWYRVSDADED